MAFRWPWQSEAREAPLEARERGFTDLVASALVAQANASLTGDPAGIAALEIAARFWSHAFAAARVTPDNERTRIISPTVRALVARDLIRKGENIHLIDVAAGRLRLHPAGSWDVRGGWDPESWRIRVDLFGPSGNVTRFVPHAQVVHCRYATTSDRPWWGVSPLAWAKQTGALAANLELRLAQEAGSPVGSLIPLPFGKTGRDGDEESDAHVDEYIDELAVSLAKAKGAPQLIETTAGGWDIGKEASPHRDWKSARFGADPPQVLDALRSASAMSVLDACGVPSALALANADGTSQREAWRRFVMGTIEPALATVRDEFAEKLDVPGLAFDLRSLWAHDIAGRAAAFKALAAGGMSLVDAVSASGVLAADDQ